MITTGPLQLYNSTLTALARGAFGNFEEAQFCAILLADTYAPNLDQHGRYGDLQLHEISGNDYGPVPISSFSVSDSLEGAIFSGDDIRFGEQVTIPPCRYLAICSGAVTDLNSNSPLFGLIDLRPAGGTVESFNAEFTIQAPENGWLVLNRAGA